jgi:hypothetical protein
VETEQERVTRILARAVYHNIRETTGDNWTRRSRINGWLVLGWCAVFLYLGSLLLAAAITARAL